jgi:cobalt-zinc-cadmium efflux system outer membrane protein
MYILNRRVAFLALAILFSPNSFGQNAGLLEPANPTFSAFINSSTNNNPLVLAAKASYAASLARKEAASRPLFNPEVGFDADNGETKDRVFSLSQTFDWANQRDARDDVATSESRRAWANYISIRRQIASELIQGLSNFKTNKAREELAEQRVSIMSDFASLSKRRFEQGDLNRVELNIASLAFMKARITHADIQVEVADAMGQIRNVEPDIEPEHWPTLDKLQALPAIDNKTILSALPNVLSAQSTANAALATVELRKREKKPSPTVSIRGGEEEDDTTVGIGFSIPLYFRNPYNAEVDVASTEYQAALQELDDVLRRTLSQLDNATLRYNLYFSAWEDWQTTGLVDLNNQADQLQTLWEAGEISTTEFLLQIQQTLDTRDSALNLHQSVRDAWLVWLMSSGKIETWLEMEVAK